MKKREKKTVEYICQIFQFAKQTYYGVFVLVPVEGLLCRNIGQIYSTVFYYYYYYYYNFYYYYYYYYCYYFFFLLSQSLLFAVRISWS